PAQGQGFELYAIAGAVIGGTSLSGGIGSVFGTLIGVYIMSVLRTGLPSMDLQAHYQTFFTGVVVIGAVLLDIYRNKRASEVKILTSADLYKESMGEKIDALKQALAVEKRANSRERVAALSSEIGAARAELKEKFATMRAEEKAELARIHAEERAAEREFHQILKREHEEAPME
ncbi:MAG: ABC transporter permease, partial [Spirochaetales bacterium]|nr:ABC transporter permease [Spirochaetales bacterium]